MPEKVTRAPRSDALASRERFMDAAARLYVDVGYDGCTIRLIAQEAKTSLARLNRHWAGKEQLFEDVFARYFTPIHQAQSLALDAIVWPKCGDQDGSKGEGELFLQVIRAFFGPAFASHSASAMGDFGHRVFCRAMIDPAPEVQRMVRDLATGIARRVSTLLRQTMPDVTPQAFFFAHSLVFGAFLHSQLFSSRVAESIDIDTDVDWTQAPDMLAEMLLNGVPVRGKSNRP